MDPRFNAIPRIMGRNDGPVDVHEPPDVNATSSIYRDLFRFDRVDPIFQSGGKSFLRYMILRSLLLISIMCLASKQASDIDLGHHSNNMLGLVSCQLLSNGFQWSSACNKLWSQ